MFSIRSKKIVAALVWFLIFSGAVLVQSCKKTDAASSTENPPDLTTKILSSVSGFVTDNADAAVEGASVQFGASTATSDKYGYFTFSNVQVVKNAAVVTVTKTGYFNGIKTYIASEGHNGFFRIKLLPKTNQGNFDAAVGGTIALPNGLSIAFPANSIVEASSSAEYTGQINVSAQWLDPVANDINKTMPGDLRGLDSVGIMKVLTSFGMSATELTGMGGELLQMAPGKKATISFPLTSATSASAPAIIPLWYFDETKGLWLQEGNAIKSGSSYVGEVSHFSWWNCDLPNATLPLTFNLVNAAGNPLPEVYVIIKPTNSWSSASGYTDSIGHVSVLVTPNTNYTIHIYADCDLNTPFAFNYDFGAGTSDINLGNIVLTGASIAAVSGTVECNSAPLADAFVVMYLGGYVHRYPVNADGTYSFTKPICSNNSNAILVAENLSTNQSSASLPITLSAGNNIVPALQACTITGAEFINYTIDGVAYSIIPPRDTMTYFDMPIVLGRGFGGTNSYHTCRFQYSSNPSTPADVQLYSFYCSEVPSDVTVIMQPSTFDNTYLHITESGAVGEYIAGNFECRLNSGIPPQNTIYNVTCSFRVKRAE